MEALAAMAMASASAAAQVATVADVVAGLAVRDTPSIQRVYIHAPQSAEREKGSPHTSWCSS